MKDPILWAILIIEAVCMVGLAIAIYLRGRPGSPP